MDARRSLCARAFQPPRQESGAESAPLHPRQQVDVKMRWIFGGQTTGGAERVMDLPGSDLLDRPVRRGPAPRFRIERPQRRPPVRLEPGFESARVERAQHIAADSGVILRNQRALRTEQGVRRGVDVAEQPGVAVEAGSVAPTVAGREADGVKRLQIVGATRSDTEAVVDDESSPRTGD